MTESRSGAVAVTARGLSKHYGGIQALTELSMTIQSGQVHALLGENGAGKSTFIKILAGAVRPDAGEIEIAGSAVALHSPHDAAVHGLAFVHQDPSLIPGLSVAENMFLGTDRYSRRGLTGRRRLRRHYWQLAARVGLDVDPDGPADRLPVAQQTLVAMGRALAGNASVIVLDEPTATFSDAEVHSLFAIIRELTAHGTGVLYVSHRLAEVVQIADVITVLKNGRHVTTLPAREVRGHDHLVDLIVGKDAVARRGAVQPARDPAGDRPASTAPVILLAEHVSDGRTVRDASISIQAGEIVGLTGLVGSGRTEFAKVLFGARRLTAGQVRLAGTPLRLRSPYAAVRAGLAFVPEDRRREGALLDLSLRENTTLPILRRFQVGRAVPVLLAPRERRFVRTALAAVAVKFHDVEQPMRQLSGGNQQKVVLTKWISTQPKLIIVDEPTQGVDVGAKAEIYAVIRDLAAAGAGVLLISSEIAEVIAHSDRVVVMREGRTVAELRQPSEDEVLRLCYAAPESHSAAGSQSAPQSYAAAERASH